MSSNARSPSYEFIQNAIIAGILVSIASGIIGSLIVVNRMVFLAGGIAHTSYGGIGMASVLWNSNFSWSIYICNYFSLYYSLYYSKT